MIIFKEIDNSYFDLYDKVSMNIDARSEYIVKTIDNGLGGLVLEETPVEPYRKDLSEYAHAAEYEKDFDITNWRYYMAFDGDVPVGAMTVAGQGAVLFKIDMYAYYLDLEVKDEVQLVWYLNI